MTIRKLVGLLLWLPAVALAAPQLPAWLTLPKAFQPNADGLVEEPFGEAEFAVAEDVEPPLQRGHHWYFEGSAAGFGDEAPGAALWAAFKPSLLAGGWSVVQEFAQNPFSATLRYTRGGKDAWLRITFFGATDIRADLVESTAPALKLTLVPPAAQPEKVSAEAGDFPYLAPLPGSRPIGSQAVDVPLLLELADAPEPQVLGSGFIAKDYADPPGLSNLQFVTAYGDALRAAGWKIALTSQSPHQSDAVLFAHYDQNGRNLWAHLHHGNGEYAIQVADVGARDLAGQLRRDCHVPLYGVLFDFDKATLKPESAPVLAQARDALAASPGLAVEVQGHTDNVGGDDYNRKLSEARAAAVMQWLVGHGIPAAQLSAKGYGKTQPVAPNDSDAGRARNRRVELACRK